MNPAWNTAMTASFLFRESFILVIGNIGSIKMAISIMQWARMVETKTADISTGQRPLDDLSQEWRIGIHWKIVRKSLTSSQSMTTTWSIWMGIRIEVYWNMRQYRARIDNLEKPSDSV